jgi:hypothetical protein
MLIQIDPSVSINALVIQLTKLYNGVLLDNIHGYLFPKTKQIDIKLFITDLLKSLIPVVYHSEIKNIINQRLPKIMINMETIAKLSYTKLEQSDYNTFINMPLRKLLLSGMNFLAPSNSSGEHNYPLEPRLIVYCGCKDDHSLWLLTQYFPETRFILFEPDIINLYIETTTNHWQLYTNPKNNIAYLSINANIPLDDLDIRPVTYFDGHEELYLLDKLHPEIEVHNSLPDDNLENYRKYIFNGNKRIFICEENATKNVGSILQKIIKLNTLTTKKQNECMLWVNYKTPAEVISLIDYFDPFIVKYITNIESLNISRFYTAGYSFLPWSNRQQCEIDIQFKPRTTKQAKFNKSELLDILTRYNAIDRVCFHANTHSNIASGFDHCGDCALEARIITNLIDCYDIHILRKPIQHIGTYEKIFSDICNITGISGFKQGGHGTLFII